VLFRSVCSSDLEELRRPAAPPLARIVVGVDPNASSDEAANSAGIVVAGHDGRPGNARSGYVLADRTIVRGGPRAWAAAAVKAYYDFQADRIVAEKNQGGEMVELTIHTVDPNVPVKLVSASRAKRTRAEPVSALYEGSETVPPRVFHVGVFPELEEEMTTWTPESESPDRMDALVWALTELMLGQSGAMKSTVPHGRIDRPTRVR
jgi:phage terminase large subunit-like protein